jgi:hypothetical protein
LVARQLVKNGFTRRGRRLSGHRQIQRHMTEDFSGKESAKLRLILLLAAAVQVYTA